MPLFFFHQHLNGRLEKDRRGRRFPSVDDARVYAVYRVSAILRKTVSPTTDTYLATEVSDGEHTLCVVRAKVIIQLCSESESDHPAIGHYSGEHACA